MKSKVLKFTLFLLLIAPVSIFFHDDQLSAGGRTYIQKVSCDSKSPQAFWHTKSVYNKEDYKRALELVQKYSDGGGYTLMHSVKLGKKYCKKQGDELMTFLSLLANFKQSEEMKKVMAQIPAGSFGLTMGFHEITHLFTSTAKFDLLGKFKQKRGNLVLFEVPVGHYSSFFLDTWGTHHLEHTAYYDSQKITEILPANKFSGSRYDKYITGDPSSASRQDGIYGLLNEYHAYFHGAYFVNNMHKAGVEKSYANEYTAFAEFTLFILKYLDYAKKNQPNVYKSNMKQKELMETFVRIHDRFEPVFCERAADYNKNDQKVSNYRKLGEVTYKGRSCSVTLDVFETKSGKSSNFAKEMENYLIELQKPEMVEMMKEARKVAGL